MPLVPQRRKALFRVSIILVSLMASAAWLLLKSPVVPRAEAQVPTPSFKNFEGPQVHPLAITPDGTRLLAVNTPNATLSVFQLTGDVPLLTAEIPVGLEPVSVAARNNREAWVVNWLSDSVSIVDLTTGNVTRTIEVGDEPTDVLFAGAAREMAFVCVSGGGRLTVSLGQITGGSGVVKVFDPSNLAAAPQTVNIFGKQPRALARDATGGRVFVSVFESGNQTTVVPEATVSANGGMPPPVPAMAGGLPAAPKTGLVVRFDGANWLDEIGRSWNQHVPYRLADVDVTVLNSSGTSVTVGPSVRGVGTHVGNMAFDANTNRLFVANLDSTNSVRFEPNLRGRFQHSRVAFLDAPVGTTPSLITNVNLNPHVDLGGTGSEAERAQSLALPADVAFGANGEVYVAATSSARVGVIAPVGNTVQQIAVGQGPTGLALDVPRSRLYVLNRFEQTLSVVGTSSKSEITRLPVGFNPEPQGVREGRRFLYDANLSAHGTVSCASCHLNGHRDGVAWDLGDPQGGMDTAQGQSFHPMKGPMTTQTLRGIVGNEPLHWRGDRAGVSSFNPAFVSLLGGPRQLEPGEMALFEEFVRSLTYPPNPNEPLNRQLSPQAQSGLGFFTGFPLDRNVAPCSSCHLTQNFRPGTDNLIIPAALLQEPQSFKTPQLRGLYQKIGMDKTAGDKLTGFGFAHDGRFDTLFNFQLSPQFNFASAGNLPTADLWRRDMERFMLELDTGTAPAVGLQVTVNADNKTTGEVTTRLNLLAQQMQAGNCEVVARGIYGGSVRGFLRQSNGTYLPDSLSEAPVTLAKLLESIGAGSELTFTGVPVGAGRRLALDRDANNVLNDDEPRTSVQLAGRVVDANGNGVAGVSVTLSGTQNAVAQTDAAGRYTFNFVSTAGAHTVTPARDGLTFTPASRSFNNPAGNVSATFVTSATANASDSSAFFVTQHYRDFLNRDPDAAGLAFWVGGIEACGSDQQCREVKRVDTSAAFFLSIEHQETSFLAYRTHKASFGNLPGKPVPVTYERMMLDGQRVARNLIVGADGWQALLEANKVAFFNGWVQRPEFVAQYPAGITAAQFVDTLNANTGGALSQPERDALVNALTNGTMTRAQVVRRTAEDADFDAAEKNRAFVLMQYHGYLRRNPDAPDFDGKPDPNFDGYNFWLQKLNDFNGNFVQAEMVRAFIISIEYRQRFGQ